MYFLQRQRSNELFAIELSNDIRGERLRFVEAMKEATTINVQSKSILFERL